MVKIGLVTAEIFLIWTNVVRTNVAWTNVTMTVGISSRWSLEANFKVLLKSVPGTYFTAEIFLIRDKCHQDKCCLDKCRHDSWNQFKMVLRTYL